MSDPNQKVTTVQKIEEDESTPQNTEIVSKLMKDPEMLAALQYKLNKYVGVPSGYIAGLPACVKRRIKALKNLQVEHTKFEVQFFNEVNALEAKYHKLHETLYKKRVAITEGSYEPTDEEADFPSDVEEEDEVELSQNLNEGAMIEGPPAGEDPTGIPEFWSTIFKNVDLLMEMVQEYDEPLLQKLRDVRLVLPDNGMGFTLEFHFDENEYFTNKVLTKEYEMRCEPRKDEPFSFEGPEINKCKGCVIDWHKGKNITVKTIKKKQKHKARGSVRTVTKTVANDSFFNFFNPPPVPEDPEEELEEEIEALLMADYEIGHYIRERIIPRAVLFFTGEALEDDDFDEEGEEEDDEDGLIEDEDEDEDPDYAPTAEAQAAAKKDAPECKQQ